MENLINYIKSKTIIPVNETGIDLIKKHFTSEKVPAHTPLLKAGEIEHYIYFLSSGIVKGYQNNDGKIVVQHLVSELDFFTSLESFNTQTPSIDYYETITDCTLIKISKSNFDLLLKESTFWTETVQIITNEHLNCKLERVQDFQLLSAKERYLKFLNQHPTLVSNVSIDNIASFLGMEPQSLSRIRKQIAF